MNAPREDYLQKIHSSMNTPWESIEKATFLATKEKVTKKKRLIEGEHSEVYDITLESGTEIILKISHLGGQFIEAEVWALEKCTQAGVLVPRVIAKQQQDSAWLLFETKLKGSTLENITPAKRRQLARQLGKMLTKMHTIPTDGFGRLDGNGKGNYATFEEFMTKNLTEEAEKATLDLANKYDFDSELIKNCYKTLRNSTEEFKKIKKGTFLHFDLLPSHVFADGDNITGIIDFGGSVGGDPVQDFVRWNYYYDESFEGLIEGYENKELLNNDFQHKLALYTLFHGFWLFAYHDKVGNADLIPNDRKNFEWALEALR